MTDANSEPAIRTIIAARADAVRAGDVEALMKDVADHVVTFDVVDPLRHEGKASSRERAAQWIKSYNEPPNGENREVNVTTDGDVAFCFGLSDLFAVHIQDSEFNSKLASRIRAGGKP